MRSAERKSNPKSRTCTESAGDLDRYRLKWQDDARRRAEFHLFWPARAFREDFSILIAGCGTEQAAKHAIRWPRAHVVAIDISETALAHEARLKHTLGLDNLDLYQLPVEHAGDLGLCFDQVVSTGVLHHLMDPDRCLKVHHIVFESNFDNIVMFVPMC